MSEDHRPWAVILGASSGFGSATAVELARRGYDICGVHLDRRATIESAERTVAAVEAAGARALFFNVNACDEERRTAVLDALAEQCRPAGVRLLLHSLAFGALRPLVAEGPKESVRKAQLDMTLDVMAHSLVYWTQDLVWRGLLGEARVRPGVGSQGGTGGALPPTGGGTGASRDPRLRGPRRRHRHCRTA
jgi:enoyl-[acyl-carrier protein] reductase III